MTRPERTGSCGVCLLGLSSFQSRLTVWAHLKLMDWAQLPGKAKVVCDQ